MLILGIIMLVLGGALFMPGMFLSINSLVLSLGNKWTGWIGVLMTLFAMLAFALSGYILGECL